MAAICLGLNVLIKVLLNLDPEDHFNNKSELTEVQVWCKTN